MMKSCLAIILLSIKCFFVTAQISKLEKQHLDSLAKTITSSNKIKQFSTVIPENSRKISGLFTIYQTEDKIYLELEDTLLSKDILLVSRISQGAPGTMTYAGDEITNIIIFFEKNLNNKILLRKKTFQSYNSDTTKPSTNAITRSSFMPILSILPIEAVSKNKSASIINITDLILGDNELFSINTLQKGNNNISGLAIDKSVIGEIQSFPLDTEIGTIKTYNTNRINRLDFGRENQSMGTPISFEINTSFVLLPVSSLAQRLADPRVGYFSITQKDFDSYPNGVTIRDYITRWKLIPRKEDMQRYLAGEVVSPINPIVFYIDPDMPPKWIPYLIQGVNDWNQAFEHAGFKNAILGKHAPTKAEDSTWSINDARHSVIVYKPSEIENASGPSIVDPRTGEILESHINFYSNVTQLAHDWYLAQCSAVDRKAAHLVFDDSLMGQLVRFIISHEVGHALGLAHNMLASSTVPVANLRNKAWVEANGICPSIMDYARFNYVAQPEDSISEKGLLPRIGVYDEWAIEWGYRLFSINKSPEEENINLRKLIIEKTKDNRFCYGPEKNSMDPRIQKEDLGDDPMSAGEYGIKNLTRITPKLIQWSKTGNRDIENLTQLYEAIVNQYSTYINHAINYISGVTLDIKNIDQAHPLFTPISPEMQRKAEIFLSKHLFNTPTWLLDTAILNRIGQTAIGTMSEIQNTALRNLITPTIRFNLAIAWNESNFEAKKTYQLINLLADLKRDIWSELPLHKPIDIYRRNLQRTYIHCFIMTFTDEKTPWRIFLFSPITGTLNITSHDAEALMYNQLKEIYKEIKKSLPFYSKDIKTYAHLSFILKELDDLWYKNK